MLCDVSYDYYHIPLHHPKNKSKSKSNQGN